MLTDLFNRKFNYLRLSITDVCNFKCNYCLPDGYECDTSRDFLTLNEIQNMVSAFAKLGVEKIRITGGEPGLRKDLPAIIRIVANTQGINKVALTTNGFNLYENVTKWHQAGLQQLNVSLDSLNASQFRLITGSNKHQQIMNGIEQAISLGIKVKINAVLLKQHNLNEMSEFLNWLKTTPVTLRFIELMQTNDNGDFFKQQHIAGTTLINTIVDMGWQPVPQEKTAGPALEFQHAQYAGKIGFIMPYSKDFCRTCNRLRVSATGNLHQCLFSDEGSNLRPLTQSVSQQAELMTWLQQQSLLKGETHQLHQHHSGATKHLAMLGG